MKIQNSQGLFFEFLENGEIRQIGIEPIRVGLSPVSSFSKPRTNLYLRKRTGKIKFHPLLGPESTSRFEFGQNTFVAKGIWEGIEYRCELIISSINNCWEWRIESKNRTENEMALDLIYLQDIGLKPLAENLINEYYISQYVERTILNDETYGQVVCCRQNMKGPTGNPWLMAFCASSAASACTDGMQFYGTSYRETGIPEALIAENLTGEYAGESSMLAVQEKPFILKAGYSHKSSFMACYLPDHPLATSLDDLNEIPELIPVLTAQVNNLHENLTFNPVNNLFRQTPFLPVENLEPDEIDKFFSDKIRHPELTNGNLLSFFYGDHNHVVLKEKETRADRPHGHIMQTKTAYTPNENIISTTCYAFGVFNSHLTQGNTNFNTFLSVSNSPFNLCTETGQRIFVEMDGKNFLLGMPSAFEMGLNHCRWIYKHGKYCFEIKSWTSKDQEAIHVDFKSLSGHKVKLIISHHFDYLNAWKFHEKTNDNCFVFKPDKNSMITGKYPEARFKIRINSHQKFIAGGDEMLYEDRQSRENPVFIVSVNKTETFSISIIGEVVHEAKDNQVENTEKQWRSDKLKALDEWQKLCLNLKFHTQHKDINAIEEILPWYGVNALTHLLTPYGLEQFSGAAWGTRDVSQGPVDLLLSLEKYEAVREILLIIFSNQNTSGDWPQWWMFDRYFNIRAEDCHGDVYYWCMIALSNYIVITGDIQILDEMVPYFHPEGPEKAEKTTLSEHVERLINMITGSFIPGTALVPFGGGDWNDSLQPVSKDLAKRMISSWTVEMNYQAFTQFQRVYEMRGHLNKASELKQICGQIKADFNKYLVKDGIVAGYGLLEDDNSISVMLHPSDKKTNIRYSILPMNRGIISGLFNYDQAEIHLDIIEKHLKGPDGARLMDRPLTYKGGIQTIFQRAESSTFFGREIGLMYIHEHIRYAEALAIMGKADEFVKALRQANPVAYNQIVSCGDIRQANCYYSSSDVAFKSRYQADELYEQVKTGKFILRGGWRVYSSGPGIYITLIVTRLLGLRKEFGNIILDPVIPFSMDGLVASIEYMNHPVTLNYSVKENNFGPKALFVNGKPIEFQNEEHKYRKGGAVIPEKKFLSMLTQRENRIEIIL